MLDDVPGTVAWRGCAAVPGSITASVVVSRGPSSVKDVALKAKGWKKVRWREGSKGWLESRFLAMRVQPSHGFVHGDSPDKEIWLLVEWPAEEKEPTKYFFCALPASYTLRRLVRIAKCRWKIEQDYH